MSRSLAALFVASTFIVLGAPSARAAPAEVNVRIEGKTETLFEGPVLSDGHNVKATGDEEAPGWGRSCDGLNNGANPTPGPTPTAAAVDAMAILGEGFDGDWYGSGSFDDYFVTQWGPERQDVGEGDYWGLLVNDVFTSIGGCQYQLDAGDEVLWTYDAFNGRPQLLLYPGDYPGGSVELTAEATLGVPFEVRVVRWGGGCCASTPPPSPTRSTTPFEGAAIGPVVSTVRGFERIDTASAEAVETDADGAATITFNVPGWHRIKATKLVAGSETVVRSNRLDVCVPSAPATDCGALPSDDLMRMPPSSDLEEEPDSGEPAPQAGGGAEQPGAQPHLGPSPPTTVRPIRIALRGLDRSRIATGIVGVGWRVLDAGPGIAKWSVSSKRLRRRSSRFITRATGKDKSSVRVRLPGGSRYALRLTVTDLLGRSSSVELGSVWVPS
jgi:Domain of unknown function (DUF4430)